MFFLVLFSNDLHLCQSTIFLIAALKTSYLIRISPNRSLKNIYILFYTSCLSLALLDMFYRTVVLYTYIDLHYPPIKKIFLFFPKPFYVKDFQACKIVLDCKNNSFYLLFYLYYNMLHTYFICNYSSLIQEPHINPNGFNVNSYFYLVLLTAMFTFSNGDVKSSFSQNI